MCGAVREGNYNNRPNEWEQLNYDSCSMLRYDGTVTAVVEAVSGRTVIESVTLRFRVRDWLER